MVKGNESRKDRYGMKQEATYSSRLTVSFLHPFFPPPFNILSEPLVFEDSIDYHS